MSLPKSHREIEYKFELTHTSDIDGVSKYLGAPNIEVSGMDSFWDLKYPGVISFLRYRHTDQTHTIKVEDRGEVVNRLEIDLPKQVTFYSPDFSLYKTASIWNLPLVDVCVYYVKELRRTFLEVEGRGMADINEWVWRLDKDGGVTLGAPETDSLFTMGKKHFAKEW